MEQQNGLFKILKPTNRPEWMDKRDFDQLPTFLVLRIVWKNKLAILTTLVDDTTYPDRKILSLYRDRWNIEVDFRSIKCVMQMDILRCKTPEMITKELWTHMLAYNIVRSIMVWAALRHDISPRSIRFKTTVQALNSFAPFAFIWSAKTKRLLYETLSQLRIGTRPFRREPRAIKRRPKNHDLLVKPRWIAREELNRLGLS